MSLSFGWNQSLEGVAVDWALASQSAVFVYLGADSAYQREAPAAAEAGLLVGPYWTLESDLDPKGQAAVFLSRFGGQVPKDQLPPALFVKKSGKLETIKTVLETVEQATGRPVLLGGTPESLKGVGLSFGRTNPLWISHKPAFGGPFIPAGWREFSLWQTPPPRPIKGVSRDVGLNVSNESFIKTKRVQTLVFGVLGVAFVAGAVYYAGRKSK